MKKVLISLAILGTLLATPANAWYRGYGYGYYGRPYYGGYYGNGGAVAGAAIGAGILGALVGGAIASQGYGYGGYAGNGYYYPVTPYVYPCRRPLYDAWGNVVSFYGC